MGRKNKRNNKSSSDSDDGGSESDTDVVLGNICDYCGKKSLNAKKLVLHKSKCVHKREDAEFIITPNGNRKFVCKTCKQTFKYMTGLTKHEKRHEPPGGFLCHLCQEPFINDFLRNTHKEQVHALYQCKNCYQQFTQDSDYVRHIQEMHDGKDREYFVCTDCGNQYRTQVQLKNHNASKCGTVKYFGCDECDSKFMTKHTLNAHKLIHAGVKKHLCSYCGSKFLNKGQLKVHIRSHTGEKPFKCDVCSKAFAYRESLVTHSSIHTGVKPYICNCCGNRFSCIGNLIKHRKTRPDTCGQPQYSNNSKAAPRPSSKNPQNFMMKTYKKFKTKVNHSKILVAPDGTIPHPRNQPKILIEQTLITPTTSTAAEEIPPPPFIEITETFNASLNFEENNENFIIFPNHPIKEEKQHEIEALNFTLVSPTVQTATDVINENNSLCIPHKLEKQEIEDDEILETQEVFTNEDVQAYTTDEYYNFVPETDEHHKWEQDDHNYDEEDVVALYSPGGSEQNENAAEGVYNIIGMAAQNDHIEMKTGICEDEDDEVQPFLEVKMDNPELGDDENDKSLHMEEYIIPSEFCVTEEIDTQSNDDDDDDDESNHLNSDSDYVPEYEEKTNAVKSRTKAGDKEKKNVTDKPTLNLSRHECNICDKTYHVRSRLLHHKIKHHGCTESEELLKRKKKEKYSCRYCTKKYSNGLSLSKHELLHGENGHLVHKCSCCQLFFATFEDAEKHQFETHRDKLVCKHCGKTFKEPDSLSAHIRYAHDKSISVKKYLYICPLCGKNFNSRVALSDHEKAKCGVAPSYKCTICNKNYHSKGSLKTHMTIHSGNMPHLCGYCGKGFRTNGQVKVHERSHNGEKPFKCTFCPKAFAHRETQLTHLSLHTGLKRFMCSGCGSRFSCISNLKAHRKSHKNTCGLVPNCTKAIGPMAASTPLHDE